MDTSAAAVSGGPRSRGLFGHPRGLTTLFLTEMWERFSYYGMRALLLYYMYDRVSDGGLGIAPGTAAALMSVYGALVYMSGALGGWLSDRVLGARRAVLTGGVLIMLGHIALALPGGSPALYTAMLLITLGTGLLKTNASGMVGELYDARDTRRDAGFSLFYMGINLGAFAAPFAIGTLGQKVDYHLGFGLAAVGMAAGLVQYAWQARRFGDVGARVPNPVPAGRRRAVAVRAAAGAAVLAAAAGGLGAAGLLGVGLVVNAVTAGAILLPIGYFTLMLRSPRTDAGERRRVRAYIPLFVASVFFWIVDEQGSTVLAQYADTRTDLHVLGFAVPSSWAQSLNPVWTLLLAPVFAALWQRLGRRQPSTPRKFTLGLVLAGASFVLMALPGLLHGTARPASAWWLVASFGLVIAGAMCLSTVGLSATTRLAPAAFANRTMALWLLSDATAQAVNAQLVPLYSAHTEVVYFAAVGGGVLVAALGMHLVTPWVRVRAGEGSAEPGRAPAAEAKQPAINPEG